MPDQPVREIQLGGKQLVFLFMASVVLAVAIFLLGISVGRGVHSAEGPSSGTDVAVNGDTDVTPLPDLPATQTTPDDSLYHRQLQSGTPQTAPAATAPAPAPKATEEPSPVAEDAGPVAVSKPAAASAPAPAASKAAEPQPQKPDTKSAVESAKAAAPAATGAGWFVTVDSFRSRGNADRQAATLKAKNYAAAVVASAGLYRVRVGPFAQRADAERVRQRLQREEGLKPSISR
jgi:DedD protein